MLPFYAVGSFAFFEASEAACLKICTVHFSVPVHNRTAAVDGAVVAAVASRMFPVVKVPQNSFGGGIVVMSRFMSASAAG